MSRRKLYLASAVCAVVGALVAACSSGGSSPAAQGPASASASASSYASLVPLVDKLEQRPASIGISTPITGKVPAGKTVAFIQCGSPICVTLGDVLAQGGAELHWKIDRIDAGLTAESIQAAWTQAVNSKPDAVITSGTSRALFNPQLAQLAAMKVPVLDFGTTDPAGDGITAVFAGTPGFTQQGKVAADYMLATGGGQGPDVLSVDIPTYPAEAVLSTSLAAELKAHCPSCSAATLNVPSSSLGSDLATRITTYLSAHRSVNWIFLTLDDMATGLPAALSAAGFGNVKVVSEAIDPTVGSYIQNGQNVVMAAGFDFDELTWRCLNYLAETWTGTSTAQTTDPATLPTWFMTKSNIPTITNDFPYVAQYQQQYETLWHV